ncbi:MAG: hypothetical protein ABH877_04185 [bacterium]
MADKPKTIPVFLLSVGLVASLGINAIQSGMVGEARAGVGDRKRHPIDAVLATSSFAGLTNMQVANGICAKANADLGLTGEYACALKDIDHWVTYLHSADYPDANGDGISDSILVHAIYAKDGTWSPGDPQ